MQFKNTYVAEGHADVRSKGSGAVIPTKDPVVGDIPGLASLVVIPQVFDPFIDGTISAFAHFNLVDSQNKDWQIS